MLFDSQFLLLHIVFVLVVYISQGEYADTKEIQLPTEEIFKVRDWKLERRSKLNSDTQRDDQFRLLSHMDFSPLGWKGLKIEMYFTPVFQIFLKTMKSILTNLIKNSYYENNKWVWFFPDISGIPDERAFETSLIYPNNNETPSVDNIVESFYVNEELIYGSRQNEERKSLRDNTTLSGKRDCSRYIVNENIAKFQGSITFSYITVEPFVGLTLILKFRQKLKSLEAINLVATQQEDNQWTLQNFGVRTLDRNLRIELEMESEEMLENLSPLMIVFNGQLICGLNTYTGVQKASSESDKGKSQDNIKEIIFEDQNWVFERYTEVNQTTDYRYSLRCVRCLIVKEWRGLKIDIYFFYPFDISKVRPSDGRRVRIFQNLNIFTWATSDITLISLKGAIFNLWVLFDKVKIPSANETVQSFYVNEELLFGNSQINYHKQHMTSLVGRKDCSNYITIDNVVRNLANITFSYTKDFYFGVTLILIFQHQFESVKTDNLTALKQEGNQWVLQNFGLDYEETSSLVFTLELESENPIENPYPLAIILNGEVLCGLPSFDLENGPGSMAYKDILKVSKLHEQNFNLLAANISLTSLLTLVIFAGIICIVYMFNTKWQISRDQNYSSESRGQEDKDLKPRHFQLEEHVCKCNDFENFVTTEYANSSAFLQQKSTESL